LSKHWYRNAVFYSLDVRSFQDSNGDGVGDLQGLISRIDYLGRLGVTVLWLSPIHPSRWRDGGYDVTDHYNVDPALGSLGDFAELMNVADERGLRVMLDLVVNHTSDQHPWFISARSDPGSPYRDWYVWSEQEPPDRGEGMVFAGVQKETWTYCDQAGAWYHHRFHDFQPDLNIANRQVREKIGKIVSFWERLGVSGFRIDGAPFVIEQTGPGSDRGDRDYGFLTDLREQTSWRRGDAVFLAEANVPNDELRLFFGDADGAANRLQMLFAFRLNEALMLALARQDPHPVIEALQTLPPLPRHGQWATFLRNHDEVDLSGLTADERGDVCAAFGPDRRHQLYKRGIRRRLAPMLDGDSSDCGLPTACSSPCRARRCCAMAMRSAWGRICDCPSAIYLLSPDPAALRRLLDAGRGHVRVVTRAPELPGGMELLTQVVGAGAIAAVGTLDVREPDPTAFDVLNQVTKGVAGVAVQSGGTAECSLRPTANVS
jgi:maltose alpha-D-glucosyltransferase/alpha-amylase